MTTITCPFCGMTSVNPEDVEQGYCARCHWWTSDPELVAQWREQWPQRVAEAYAFRDERSRLGYLSEVSWVHGEDTH